MNYRKQDRVKCKEYGEGTVTIVNETEEYIVVRFDNTSAATGDFFYNFNGCMIGHEEYTKYDIGLIL